MKQIINVLLFLTTIIYIVACKDNGMKDYSLRSYKIKNPDGGSIALQLVPYSVVNALLKDRNYQERKIRRGFSDHKLYIMNDGKQLFEATLDFSYYFLFENEEEINKFFFGKTYSNVSLHFDKDQNIHASFNMEPDQSINLIKKSIGTDTTFKVKGSSLIYVLYKMQDGSCCYLYHRISDLYDGYWFNNQEDFNFFFRNIFN